MNKIAAGQELNEQERAIASQAVGGNTDAFGQALGTLSANRVNFRLGIFEDNKQYVSSDALSHVVCSGMYLSRFN